MSINRNKDSFFLKLAFNQAKINLGSTLSNPSVGCVLVKNNSVISSGRTSLNGRPHAEANALNKKVNVKGSSLYVTLEPCSHYGETPPCIKNIIKKKLHKVIFSINDVDKRSKNLAYIKLKKSKIGAKRFMYKSYAEKFYKSYFLQSSKHIPFIDAKLAVSNDYLTINRKNKWITNKDSRKVGNFLRSKYDCILSTSKTINNDNPMLDCRIKGLEHKSPVLIVVDRLFKIKKKLKIFKIKSRKIFIFTQTNNNHKEKYFKKIGINIVKLKSSNNLKNNISEVYFHLKKLGFNRILVESGLQYINQLLRHNLIKNFFLFKSPFKLSTNGKNNTTSNLVKKLKTTVENKIKVNLNGDSFHEIHL